MNKKKAMVIASAVHIILWTVILLASVIGRFMYSAPEKEPLDLFMTLGVYNVFIMVAIAGVVNATVLFLSLRTAASSDAGKQNKGMRITALCFSAVATILFYLFAVLLFMNSKDWIAVFPFIWLLCELSCGVLLVLSCNKVEHLRKIPHP